MSDLWSSRHPWFDDEYANVVVDATDGGADLEDGGDGELSLAYRVGGESQMCWSAGSDDDREQAVQASSFG